MENMTNTPTVSDQIKQAVKEVYLADVEAIRNLSEVATKLQAGGLTIPGHTNTRGNIVVGNGSTTNAKDLPSFMNLSVENHDNDTHIRMQTKNDNSKNVYMVNRDGHFRIHHEGKGDLFGVNKDGHTSIKLTKDQDHGLNISSDSNHPYITLSRSGGDNWTKKAIYIQNHNAHTENPVFNVGIHGGSPLMLISPNDGARWYRKDGTWTHLDHTDGKNYIRGDTIFDGKIISKGVGMRTWIINSLPDQADSVITDPEGIKYNAGQWILGIFGMNQDASGNTLGRIECYTYVGSDNNWWIRTELEASVDKTGVRIIAIPHGYFDKIWGILPNERVSW
jgi:hypothetical protein